MADFRVIADVSSSLQTLLDAALVPLGVAAKLHDLGTPVPTNPPILTIFLYEVSEDAASRNRPDVRRVVGPNAISVERAPMALLLKYLITPWSGDAATDHRILGRSMQVLYDNAIVADTQLQGSLANTSDTLKITITPLSMEERAKVWYAVQRTYRLSSAYEVRVVNLDSSRRETRPAVREFHRYSGDRIRTETP
jgi:hypothetical protein